MSPRTFAFFGHLLAPLSVLLLTRDLFYWVHSTGTHALFAPYCVRSKSPAVLIAANLSRYHSSTYPLRCFPDCFGDDVCWSHGYKTAGAKESEKVEWCSEDQEWRGGREWSVFARKLIIRITLYLDGYHFQFPKKSVLPLRRWIEG